MNEGPEYTSESQETQETMHPQEHTEKVYTVDALSSNNNNNNDENDVEIDEGADNNDGENDRNEDHGRDDNKDNERDGYNGEDDKDGNIEDYHEDVGGSKEEEGDDSSGAYDKDDKIDDDNNDDNDYDDSDDDNDDIDDDEGLHEDVYVEDDSRDIENDEFINEYNNEEDNNNNNKYSDENSDDEDDCNVVVVNLHNSTEIDLHVGVKGERESPKTVHTHDTHSGRTSGAAPLVTNPLAIRLFGENGCRREVATRLTYNFVFVTSPSGGENTVSELHAPIGTRHTSSHDSDSSETPFHENFCTVRAMTHASTDSAPEAIDNEGPNTEIDDGSDTPTSTEMLHDPTEKLLGHLARVCQLLSEITWAPGDSI